MPLLYLLEINLLVNTQIEILKMETKQNKIKTSKDAATKV